MGSHLSGRSEDRNFSEPLVAWNPFSCDHGASLNRRFYPAVLVFVAAKRQRNLGTSDLLGRQPPTRSSLGPKRHSSAYLRSLLADLQFVALHPSFTREYLAHSTSLRKEFAKFKIYLLPDEWEGHAAARVPPASV